MSKARNKKQATLQQQGGKGNLPTGGKRKAKKAKRSY